MIVGKRIGNLHTRTMEKRRNALEKKLFGMLHRKGQPNRRRHTHNLGIPPAQT